MKILFVSNDVDGCGVGNFGRQQAAAFAAWAPQHTVVSWNGNYSVLHAREERGESAYFPEDVETYDVVHLNWHPGALNHYLPAHLPERPIRSAYLHDVPPWSSCPFRERLTCCFELGLDHPLPVVDYYTPQGQPDFTGPPVLGYTGIRGEGREALEAWCAQRGWIFNGGTGRWLSTEAELDRLAASWVTVCWTTSPPRAQSAALTTLIAAGRPVVLNAHDRFLPFVRHTEVLYVLTSAWDDALPIVAEAARLGAARLPDPLRLHYGWKHTVARWVDIWAGVRNGRVAGTTRG